MAIHFPDGQQLMQVIWFNAQRLVLKIVNKKKTIEQTSSCFLFKRVGKV